MPLAGQPLGTDSRPPGIKADFGQLSRSDAFSTARTPTRKSEEAWIRSPVHQPHDRFRIAQDPTGVNGDLTANRGGSDRSGIFRCRRLKHRHANQLRGAGSKQSFSLVQREGEVILLQVQRPWSKYTFEA
jgi:hypothetical protein